MTEDDAVTCRFGPRFGFRSRAQAMRPRGGEKLRETDYAEMMRLSAKGAARPDFETPADRRCEDWHYYPRKK